VLEFDVDYPDDPTITSERFFIRGIAARDFDRDGMPELLLTLSHEQQHPAIVLRIDPETFEVFNRYDHAGAFYVMDLADLDGDGRAEVLLGGTNNALQSAVIVALDPVGFRGTGPSLGHRRHGLPLTGGELAYLRFVPSSVAKALGTRENNVNNSDRGIAVEGERIFVQVYATSIFLDDQTRKRAMLTYGFDNRLRALSVTTDDFYWEVLAGLMAEGRLPYRTNKAEVDSLLRGIRYWDGEGWRDSVWTRLGEGMSTAAPTP
jgi:hypothetical protein